MSFSKIGVIAVAVFVLAGALVVALDWQQMRLIIGHTDWPLLVPAALLTLISYAALSASSVVVFRSFGLRVPIRDLLEISFVANVTTFLVNVGGLTGLPIQVVLLRRRGLSTEQVLAPSFFELYFSSLVLIILLPIGLFSVVSSRAVPAGAGVGIGIGAAALSTLLVLAGLVVFVGPIRAAVLDVLGKVVRSVIKRSIDSALRDFDAAMTRGIEVMRGNPRVLVLLLSLTVVDWLSTLGVLWFCFESLGTSVGAGTLVTGFSLGIAAGFVSFIPGGLGVQEGSMAGVYALLGVPLRSAVLAAILFRVVYYFIPFLVSLGFYRRLLRAS